MGTPFWMSTLYETSNMTYLRCWDSFIQPPGFSKFKNKQNEHFSKQKCQETISSSAFSKRHHQIMLTIFVVHLLHSSSLRLQKNVILKPSQEPSHPIVPPQWEHHENPWRLRCDKKSSRVRPENAFPSEQKKCQIVRELEIYSGSKLFEQKTCGRLMDDL